MARIALRRIARLDVLTGGLQTISGPLKVLTAPASRPVYLFDQETLALRRATRSAVDGSYAFTNLAAGRDWMVVAIDDTGLYNATIADRVRT